MTAFGVTPTGFVAPTVADLIAQMETDQLAGISGGLDVSPDSAIGQLNGIYAFYLDQAWQALSDTYDGFDPDKADATMLTNLAKLTGVARRGATHSQATLTCTLTAGTKLIAGTHFANVIGRPDVKWTPVADFTAPSDGSFAVAFQSEATGAVLAAINIITTIATPVVGWSAITASSAVTLGRVTDTDATLRARRPPEIAIAGASTVGGIAARVEQISDSITVLNNTSDYVDANGLPAHSYEAIVSSAASDDAIAQVTWNNGATGIPARGSSSGTAIDVRGRPQIVSFTRPTPVPIWVVYSVTPRTGYDASRFLAGVFIALSEGVVTKEASGALTTILPPYGTGVDVTLYDLIVATQGLSATVNSVTFGLAASPTSSTDIPIGVREIASFDLSRITVT